MRHLPNILTLGRLLVLPPIIGLMMLETLWASWIALGLYIAGALTDWLDGMAARHFKVQSPFGTFLDPIADKIFVMTILLMLVANGTLQGVWLIPAILILAREFLISGLREFLGPKNIQVPVSPLGKWKTTIQMVALGFLLMGRFGDQIWPLTTTVGLTGLVIATALTIITGWTYLKTAFKHLS